MRHVHIEKMMKHKIHKNVVTVFKDQASSAKSREEQERLLIADNLRQKHKADKVRKDEQNLNI